MSEIDTHKAQARKDAFQRRKAAFNALSATPKTRLDEVLADFKTQTLAAYMPIRTEISPLPSMQNHGGNVCIPVIQGAAQPLKFALWTPDTLMTDGPFGACVPQSLTYVTPQVLIVPLVAFDTSGNRLGYGGGFYDRTLELLRKGGKITAIGYAFEAQCAQDLPMEPTDQPLDFIVTEEKIRSFPL